MLLVHLCGIVHSKDTEPDSKTWAIAVNIKIGIARPRGAKMMSKSVQFSGLFICLFILPAIAVTDSLDADTLHRMNTRDTLAGLQGREDGPQKDELGALRGLSQTCQLELKETNKKKRDCFESKCWCTSTTADCSNNEDRLTYIPKLPASIRFLNFSGNNLGAIHEGFFANVSGLTSLSLGNNSIAEIHPDAFRPLKKLRSLYLNHNDNLTARTLRPVFQIQSLECVDLRYGSLQVLPEDLLQRNLLPNLVALFLHDNDLEVLNLTVFQQLSLRVLSWGSNDVYQFNVAEMSQLQRIDLFSNRIVDFPQTCKQGSEFASLFPELRTLLLNKNKIDKIPSTICLPKLDYLDLSGNFFPTLKTDMFRPSLFPQLSYVFLEGLDTHVEHIQPFAFRHPELKFISVMYNDIDFSLGGQYSDDSFAGCPKLQSLQLSHNYFTEATDERFRRLIGNITTLEFVYMGGVGLQQITTHTFSSLPRLKVLELYQNKVPAIPDGAFDQNREMYELQLNENRITTISPTTFSEGLRKNFSWLDLSGNPFVCDCDLRWFGSWLQSNASAFSHSWSMDYNCSNLDNDPVVSFPIPDQACLFSRSQNVIIIGIFSSIIVVILLIAFTYHFRYRMRLKLYEVSRGRADYRRHVRLTGDFEYDVFVCYADADCRWVQEVLAPVLENDLKLKACIHERDFTPGKQDLGSAVHCIERSQKVLLVFSKHFMLSNWCQFELGVCLEHALDCRDGSLVVTCVDDVAEREQLLTQAMRAVMTTFDYLQWYGHPCDKELFWIPLKKKIDDIVPCKANLSSVMTVD